MILNYFPLLGRGKEINMKLFIFKIRNRSHGYKVKRLKNQ